MRWTFVVRIHFHAKMSFSTIIQFLAFYKHHLLQVFFSFQTPYSRHLSLRRRNLMCSRSLWVFIMAIYDKGLFRQNINLRMKWKQALEMSSKKILARPYIHMVDSVIIGKGIPSLSVDEYTVQFCLQLKLFLLDNAFCFCWTASMFDLATKPASKDDSRHLLFSGFHRHVADFSSK